MENEWELQHEELNTKPAVMPTVFIHIDMDIIFVQINCVFV